MRKPADEDIRAQILRHEGQTDQFKPFLAAYAKTAPKPIFSHDDEEADKDKDK